MTTRHPWQQPPIVAQHDGIAVVRDDLLPGGTKLRYLGPLVDRHAETVYATPAHGGAQLALAYAAAYTGRRATLFTAKRKSPHARTLEAKAAGARVFLVPHGYLSHVQAKAKAYAEATGAHLLAFGGESEATLDTIAAAAADVWAEAGPFDEVWSAAGSGVLTRGLQRGMPEAAAFHAVAVGRALSPEEAGRATVHETPLRFEQEDRRPAPFPSCPNYDRKAWHACTERRAPGARVLFWNVLGPSPTAHAAPA